jgi:hypothetical protein
MDKEADEFIARLPGMTNQALAQVIRSQDQKVDGKPPERSVMFMTSVQRAISNEVVARLLEKL